MSPDDWAAGRDTQLETAVRLALEALTAAARGATPRHTHQAVQAPTSAAATSLDRSCGRNPHLQISHICQLRPTSSARLSMVITH